MKKITLKKINACLLATVMLSGSALAEKNESRIERFILDDSTRNDYTYSYIIRDEEENLFSPEEVVYYNNAIRAILNYESSVELTGDEEIDLRLCNAVHHSPYDMLLDHITYSPNNHTINYEFLYDYNTQQEVISFVEDKYKEIKELYIKDDMNTMDKIMTLFNYAVDNFAYCINYPGKCRNSLGNPMYMHVDKLLKTNVGVCHSYAYFLDFFCKEEGIESYLITGKLGKASHMWNMIKFDDDNFYFIDITEAIFSGKILSNRFTCFGITNEEWQMYGYSLPKEDKLKTVKMHVKGLQDLRYFKNCEYMGNHLFKLSCGKGTSCVHYYNTETRELIPEEKKTLTK